MQLDVAAIRAGYPALADGYAYLDGAAGTQVPAAVIDAITSAQSAGLGNLGGAFPASHRAEQITARCRAAIAALTGGEPDGVVLGPSMTALTYRFAATLSAAWGPAGRARSGQCGSVSRSPAVISAWSRCGGGGAS